MKTKFRLISPYDKNKVLTVSVYGKISYDTPGTDDDVWMLIQAPIDLLADQDDTTAGFYLVSFKYKFALVYTPKISGEEVTAVPFILAGTESQRDASSDGAIDEPRYTIWKVSPDSEIYTYVKVEESPGGGNIVISKKFLWSILDGVYVTADEHLAEKWMAVTLDGDDVERFDQNLEDNPESYLWAKRVILGIILICIFVILLRAIRKH